MVNAGLAPQSRPKNDRPSRRHLHQKRDLKAAAQVCDQGWVLLHRKPIPLRGFRVGPNRGTSGRQRALFVDQLLAQDVCVPAVLCKFAQHVQVHPAQR